MLACGFDLLPSSGWEVVPLSLQKDTEQQQRLVVLLRAVVFDLVHDELVKLLEWPCRVLNQQLLEACEAKVLIFRIGYFRDPIGVTDIPKIPISIA
jgi:hypothetical protein